MRRSLTNSGFTLLEVILTIAILMTMTIAFTTMLQQGFQIRSALSERGLVTHRLATGMFRLSQDIEHAFLVSSKDQQRVGPNRRTRTIFRIDVSGDSDKIAFTTMNHRSFLANAAASDQSFVVYEVRDDRENPGQRHLYRGELPYIPDDFRQDPPMRLFAKHVRSMKLWVWTGDGWANDGWDSSRGDWVNKLPHLVRVELEGLAQEPEEDEGASASSATGALPTVPMRTVVSLPYAFGMPELKQRLGSFKWY